MAKVIVIYYSSSGNTKKMAQLIADSIKKERLEVELKDVEEVNAKDLLGFDGIIVGSPTYYGSMSFQIKKLFDQTVRFHGQLDGKVGAGAKAVQPQAPTGPDLAQAQGAAADDAGAEQGGCLCVSQPLGDRVGRALVDHSVLGIPAINVQAGEASIGAQVFAALAAENALSAAPVEPAHTRAIPDAKAGDPCSHSIHHAHDLVPRDDGQPGQLEFAHHRMQVGVTDPTCLHLQPHLPQPRDRVGDRS